MANTVRDGANSTAGTVLVDNETDSTLLVTADGYYSATTTAVALNGAGSDATIGGIVKTTGTQVAFTAGNKSNLTVLASGTISGADAVQLTGATHNIINYGTISGLQTAVRINAAVAGSTQFDNVGVVKGHIIFTALPGVGGFHFENTGRILGGISSSAHNNEVSNHGIILNSYSGGDGDDLVSNYGEIYSVWLGNGTNQFVNERGAAIRYSVSCGAGWDTISNAGTIKYEVNLGDGFNDLLNRSGGIIEYAVRGGADTDNILNAGMIGSEVNLGDGWNELTNESGAVIGYSVTGGAGMDMISNAGTIKYEVNLGKDGNLGNSGDIGYFVKGSGTCEIQNSGTIGGVELKSSADGHTYVENGGTIRYGVTCGAGNDVVNNTGTIDGTTHLNAGDDAYNGGVYRDLVFGGTGNDTLSGRAGSDMLWGNVGSDKLNGGAGRDVLNGGVGRDILSGGADADTFVYFGIDDSTIEASGRDTVFDFQYLADKIDLSKIDANGATTGDDAFSFIGAASFAGHAGELRAEIVGGTTVLSGDVDGDGAADFAINLKGTPTLSTADLVL